MNKTNGIDWVEVLTLVKDLRRELVKDGKYVMFLADSFTWGVLDLSELRLEAKGLTKKKAMLEAGFSELESTLETDFCGFDMARDTARRKILELTTDAGDDFVDALEALERR